MCDQGWASGNSLSSNFLAHLKLDIIIWVAAGAGILVASGCFEDGWPRLESSEIL